MGKMGVQYLFVVTIFMFLWDHQTVSSLPALARQKRQGALFNSLVSFLPKGKHKLDLGSWGGLDFGVNDDGTVNLGGRFNPITGVELGGETIVGGSELNGLTLSTHGSAQVQNDMLGIKGGVGGGFQGAVNGLSAQGQGMVQGGGELAGLGALSGGAQGGGGAAYGVNGVQAGFQGAAGGQGVAGLNLGK